MGLCIRLSLFTANHKLVVSKTIVDMIKYYCKLSYIARSGIYTFMVNVWWLSLTISHLFTCRQNQCLSIKKQVEWLKSLVQNPVTIKSRHIDTFVGPDSFL